MHYNAHVTWIHNDTVVLMTQKLHDWWPKQNNTNNWQKLSN